MDQLPYDLILYIIENNDLSFRDIESLLTVLDETIDDIPDSTWKRILAKYEVKYENSNDFIYIKNETTIEKNPRLIDKVKLYYKFFDQKEIKQMPKKITYIPIYPNLMNLDCSHNSITTLLIMPNLIKLYCNNTSITTLPYMPNLTHLNCNNTMITIQMGQIRHIW